MADERAEITKLSEDFVFESSTHERVDAPLKKLLKFHVLPFEQTTQVNNYKTQPNGDPNPDFGKEQPVLIFKAELDESDAKGQWYSAWCSGYYKEVDGKQVSIFSMGAKAKLGKIAEALLGDADELKSKTAGALVGLPFQCSLKLNTKGDRQVLDIDKIMPPADGQTVPKPTGDVVLADIPDGDADLMAEFDKAI